MVPVHGFEPQFAASKADVLPLDETGKLAPVFRLGEVAQSLFSAPIALPLCGVIPFAVHRQPFTGCTDSGDQKWKPVLPMRHNTKSP